MNFGRLLDQVKSLTSRPIGVSFIVAPEYMEDADPGCICRDDRVNHKSSPARQERRGIGVDRAWGCL